MGTAHLSILITVGYYVFALDPDEDPHVAANGGTTAWGGNPVDRYFVGILRKGFIKSSLRRIAQAEVAQTLEKAFNRVSRLPILLVRCYLIIRSDGSSASCNSAIFS